MDTSQSLTDFSLTLPSSTEITSVLLLQAGINTTLVVLGTTFLGVAAGVTGTFAVLRKRALIGDALAHSALPGIAVAFIIGSLSGFGGRHLWLLLLGATLSGILGVLAVQLLSRSPRIHEDTAIGVVLSCFFATGVVLMSVIQNLGTGEEGGLHHFIFGQTAAMGERDAWLTLAAAILSLLAVRALYKEFKLVSFDEAYAYATGWPVSLIDLALMIMVTIITVIGLQAVGLLLIVALLIIPAASARFWTDRLHLLVVTSAAMGGLSGYFGSVASALLPRLPTGAVIVLVAGMLFFVSFLFAPLRGVLSLLTAHLRMRIRVTEDHLLRELYERIEIEGGDTKSSDTNNHLNSVPLRTIPLIRSWSPIFRFLFLHWLIGRSLISIKSNGNAVLLPQGLELAQQKVRNHRLWEEYLLTYADVSHTHIDYSADLVEHVLSPEIVHRLEEKLIQAGTALPQRIPESRHPIPKAP
ncbi:MAG: metal ABC transporter permease [Bdellovibrionales bacterium]|nr:metal ABC transporter permease [Bdellovibrionales bacterium]